MSESKTITESLFFVQNPANAGTSSEVRLSEKAKAGQELVDRIRSGHPGAFDEFYHLFAPLVHGIVLARVPRNDVDDVVQEVFLRAYQNLPALRDKNSAGAWLAMIARNRSSELFRRAKPTEELPDDLSRTDRPHAEAREILTAIRSLPESYKETLVLRLVEGMTGQEIAEQTGLTPDSVRVNLHRGMNLLRRKLGIQE